MLVALLLAAACNSGGASPGSPTAVPSLGDPAFDSSRALRHVKALAEDIGVRPAGSDGEIRAAQYLLTELKAYGYRTEEQTFQYQSLSDDGTLLQVLEPDSRVLNASLMIGSIAGTSEGTLLAAGSGRPEEFSLRMSGNIALVQRGQLDFGEKVANAVNAGAIGVIVYNFEPGAFIGNLQSSTIVPVVSVSQENGQYLLSRLGSGNVRIRIEVRAEEVVRTSLNIIARPPFGTCRALVGAHYDSVPVGPGANDNASGVATLLELARGQAAAGFTGNTCFALFAASETGQLGSQAFFKQISLAEKAGLKSMIDLDAVGVGELWRLVGDQRLARIAAGVAADDDLDAETALAGALETSDIAAFLDAGIPALRLTAAPDPREHTASDVSVFVRPEMLAQAARLAAGVILATASQP